jgi:transposase
MIQKIYRVESVLRDEKITEEEFLEKRRKQAGPLLDKFKSWLDDKALNVRPHSNTGQAISYTLGQWEKIIHYLDSLS